jgi:hypothetical protein
MKTKKNLSKSMFMSIITTVVYVSVSLLAAMTILTIRPTAWT